MHDKSAQQPPIHIQTDKTRLARLFLGSIVFVVGGLWFVTHPYNFKTPNRTAPPLWIIGIGVSAILFFGVFSISILRKLLDRSPGLSIRHDGIYDNFSLVSVGLIPWEDISEIRLEQVMNQQFLLVMVKDPEHYITSQTSALKRMIMRKNHQGYGTPVTISATGQKTTPDELYQILSAGLKRSRKHDLP